MLQHSESYTPSFGLVTSHQVCLAIAELDRLEREGKDHGRVLIAQGVLLAKWRKSGIPSSIRQAAYEADYEDIKVTKKTKADIYISKIHSVAHQCGVNELIYNLRHYSLANGDILQAGGGICIFRAEIAVLILRFGPSCLLRKILGCLA